MTSLYYLIVDFVFSNRFLKSADAETCLKTFLGDVKMLLPITRSLLHFKLLTS